MTIVIITTLNANTRKVFTVTMQHTHMSHDMKEANEYGQEIPQSHTADKPRAPRGRTTTITIHQEDKQSKTSSLFPIMMIAKLEMTQSNAQQNIEHITIMFCLFDLILYVPSTIFQL